VDYSKRVEELYVDVLRVSVWEGSRGVTTSTETDEYLVSFAALLQRLLGGSVLEIS
jgi:hypothetical protein